MFIFNKDCYLLWSCLCFLIGLITYFYGFFPLNSSTKWMENHSSNEPKYSIPIKRQVDKLVLIVIDSLRYDFVISKTPPVLMPFTTTSLLKNESCFLVAKADSPTVTMPRIKAMTSGAPSTYVDVILNLMSSNFYEDNFVKKAALSGLHVIFYGDDTWLKLFPKTFFRSEGTNSFFALDFTEVDNNVTRHISSELEKTDWDVMILHYLGLDHIGHLEGPKSIHIKPKLKEMDGIIQKISNHLKNLEKQNGFKTMLLLTSDHGMKNSGGHGGTTFEEVMVPIVSVGNVCKKLPGWPKDSEVLQIDIAPTVSALLGLSPPSDSIGKVIPHLLHSMTTDDILKYLEINRLQFKKFDSLYETDMEFHSAVRDMQTFLSNKNTDETKRKMIVSRYFQYLNDISQSMAKGRSNFRFSYLALGLILQWSALFFLIFQALCMLNNVQILIKMFLLVGVILHGVSLVSSSFIEEEHQTWYFLWITLLLLTVIQLFRVKRDVFFCDVKSILPWIILCFVHRILRKLNQTGDKWASLPDIKSFLNTTEGQPWLNFLFFTGMVMIFCLVARRCSKGQLICCALCLFCVACFKIKAGNINVKPFDLHLSSWETLEIITFWIFFLAFCVFSIYNRTPVYLNWLIFGSLLLRPHNVILLPTQVLISKQIDSLFTKKEVLWNTIAHVWLGNVFYFYQGNSNSLANVDVTPAFIGVKTYSPSYAGFMTTAHTFNSQILSYMLSSDSNLIHVILRLIPLVFYCTSLLFQSNHLFIWSVFSPKLLYEGIRTVTIFTLIFVKEILNWRTTINE